MASEIRVNSINNRSGLGTVTIADSGIVVSGIITATTFSGNVTGNLTGNVTGDVNAGVITATSLNTTGNVEVGTGVTIYASSGIVSATTFYGDASGLSNVPAGSSLTGNFTITNGNVVVSNGYGIDFSATSDVAGMASELLDDYEEGTYTPVLSGGGYTYGVGPYTAGRYTKVGRQVTVDAMINISTISGSSDGSSVRITLPFNPVQLSTGARWAQTPCRLVYFNSTAIQRIYCVQLTTNSNSLDLVYYYTSGGNGTDAPVNIGADYQSASNNGQIAFTISYITS